MLVIKVDITIAGSIPIGWRRTTLMMYSCSLRLRFGKAMTDSSWRRRTSVAGSLLDAAHGSEEHLLCRSHRRVCCSRVVPWAARHRVGYHRHHRRRAVVDHCVAIVVNSWVYCSISWTHHLIPLTLLRSQDAAALEVSPVGLAVSAR